MTEMEKKVILSICECNMNILSVSRKLYVHRNTVIYHIEKIIRKYDLDPRHFYDLVKLKAMVDKEEAESQEVCL